MNPSKKELSDQLTELSMQMVCTSLNLSVFAKEQSKLLLSYSSQLKQWAKELDGRE